MEKFRAILSTIFIGLVVILGVIFLGRREEHYIGEEDETI